MNKFSERLKIALEQKQMSQRQLSKLIDKSQSVVNNYCTGKREPTLDVLLKISKALNVTADF